MNENTQTKYLQEVIRGSGNMGKHLRLIWLNETKEAQPTTVLDFRLWSIGLDGGRWFTVVTPKEDKCPTLPKFVFSKNYIKYLRSRIWFSGTSWIVICSIILVFLFFPSFVYAGQISYPWLHRVMESRLTRAQDSLRQFIHRKQLCNNFLQQESLFRCRFGSTNHKPIHRVVKPNCTNTASSAIRRWMKFFP